MHSPTSRRRPAITRTLTLTLFLLLTTTSTSLPVPPQALDLPSLLKPELFEAASLRTLLSRPLESPRLPPATAPATILRSHSDPEPYSMERFGSRQMELMQHEVRTRIAESEKFGGPGTGTRAPPNSPERQTGRKRV